MNKKIMSLVLSGSLILTNGINTTSVFADNMEETYICSFHNIENCNDVACIQSEYTKFRCLLSDEVRCRMEELDNLYYQQPYEHQVVLDEFNIIEARMEKIANIDGISKIEPMHYPFEVQVVLRDENNIQNEDVEDILKNSDKINDRDIEVPKVVG